MAKTQEELNTLKTENETLNNKINEISSLLALIYSFLYLVTFLISLFKPIY